MQLRNRAPAASAGGGVPAPADRFPPAAARMRTGPAVPPQERRHEPRLRPSQPLSFHSPDSPNCITSVIQWKRYIQMLAEWVIAAKATAMKRSLALLLIPLLTLGPA